MRAAQPSGGMRLPTGWYAILESAQVRRGAPLGVRRFGLDVVAWRDADGAVVVQEDRCPHRSARLSLGGVDGDTIVCPFHAWRFGRDGACRLIPENRRGAEGVRVSTFPAREAHGLVWTFWGPSEEADAHVIPWFENLAEGYTCGGFHETWPTHFTRAVENQLDWAHLPYVHRTTIGRFVKEDAPPPEVVCTPERIFWAMPSGRDGYIEFRFPNVWQNKISATYSITLCFVPVDDGHTELILRSHAASAAARLPLVGRLFMGASNLLNRVILGQDRAVVLSQRPIDATSPHDEILVRSDQAIRWFREQLAARGWASEPPVPAPV